MAKLGKRKRYDDQFRASAIVYLQAAGYPTVFGALSRISAKLDVPTRTLNRWWKSDSNPPPDNLVSEKRIDLVQAIREEAYAALREMGNAREEASYRDLGIVTGIMLDKLQLLTGQPTQRVETIASMLDELPDDEYSAIIEEARQVIARSGGGDTGGA